MFVAQHPDLAWEAWGQAHRRRDAFCRLRRTPTGLACRLTHDDELCCQEVMMMKSTCLRSATQELGLLPSCATLAYPLFTTADRSVLPTGTVPQARVTPEQVAETAGIKVTAAPAAFPLWAPGSYGVGVREFSAQDASRDDREVDASVWHPALLPEGATGKRTMAKVEPDRSDPPYPLIVSSAKMGSDLAPYAVTHGFFWAGLTRIDT